MLQLPVVARPRLILLALPRSIAIAGTLARSILIASPTGLVMAVTVTVAVAMTMVLLFTVPILLLTIPFLLPVIGVGMGNHVAFRKRSPGKSMCSGRPDGRNSKHCSE